MMERAFVCIPKKTIKILAKNKKRTSPPRNLAVGR